jgi:hypothetical protein
VIKSGVSTLRFLALIGIIGLLPWAVVATTTAARSAQTVIAGHDVTIAPTSTISAFLTATDAGPGVVHVDAWEADGGRVVRNFDIDMTKIMHMIVVSDDLVDFQHVHPILLANGHLAIDVHLAEPPARYHVYLDGLPHGAGRHVFRFDLAPAGLSGGTSRALHAAGSSVRVGPYTVEIQPSSIPIGEIATISVRILKDGKPAKDLHPYLGMMSHGVFVGTKDLAYMHAHGMTSQMLDMSDADDCGDSMMMQMPPIPPGATIGNEFELQVLAPSSETYDLWLQFIGGATLYTAPLLVTTK